MSHSENIKKLSTYSSTAFIMSSLKWTSLAWTPKDVASTIVNAHRDVSLKISTFSLSSIWSSDASICVELSAKIDRKVLIMSSSKDSSRNFLCSTQMSSKSWGKKVELIDGNYWNLFIDKCARKTSKKCNACNTLK